MADVVRDLEFFDLLGHQRRADLGRRALVAGAYLDTGAGRTIVSSRIADRVRMIEVPSYRIQYTVPIVQVASTRMTAMRLRVPGCARRPPIPMLVAVSDEIIGKLELPGVEVLVGQDYMQAARLRMDLAPGRESQEVSCRAPPRGHGKTHYGEAARATRSAPSTDPALWTRRCVFGVTGGPCERRYGRAVGPLTRDPETHTAELDDGTIIATSKDLLALRGPAIDLAKKLGKRVTVRHARRGYEAVWRTDRDGGLRDMRGKPVNVGLGLDHHGRFRKMAP